MGVQTYRDLLAWRRAMDLVVEIYEGTRYFPKEELFGLVTQMRRAAVSIPSNIAEGQGRGAGQEFAHHLRIAQGSLQELESQILLAEQLKLMSHEICQRVLAISDEVGKLLRRLHQSISRSRMNPKPATSN